MDQKPRKDRPWIFRTYAGHSTPAASNALYRTNLAKGQTGLSVAFDLPTQTGYDSDHALARGEVGKVGVPIAHLGDMRELFTELPLDQMNTSMTINATAPWLLSLYIALADERGTARKSLAGTVQNDLVKEYLSRGTYIYPPQASMRLTSDVIAFTYSEMPKWNPMNVCSYHLQEAGATPEQELSYALATAMAVLDDLKARPEISAGDFEIAVSRISFFVNAGLRFVTEMCKMRAFTELWDEICRDRYGVTDEKARRFRYGVQVNSLGLTEQQPENNVYRILIEMLAVVLSKNARARAVQLPAWNEALGLPRPWDQQWSLRMQQIMALETDLLEYGDLFDGNPEIHAKVESLKTSARAEIERVGELGGTIAALESSYIKNHLVESNARRMAAIESGEQVVVGVNAFEETALSPLSQSEGMVQTVDPAFEDEQIARLEAWRAARSQEEVDQAVAALKTDAASGANVMPGSIACAKAGVTTGEWAGALRDVFGEYRAPTGVSMGAQLPADHLAPVRAKVEQVSKAIGRRIKILVGKPGLDGHSNGAEQIALRARDSGMEVVYEGIRLTPAEIVNTALEEGVHLIGLSILSGSHIDLVTEVIRRMKAERLDDVLLILGGIIPPEDEKQLLSAGVSAVFTPKDYKMDQIMMALVELVEAKHLVPA